MISGITCVTTHWKMQSLRDHRSGIAEAFFETAVMPYIVIGEARKHLLQLACAMEATKDAIVTRDPSGFAGAPIPVLTPADLLARLAQRTP